MGHTLRTTGEVVEAMRTSHRSIVGLVAAVLLVLACGEADSGALLSDGTSEQEGQALDLSTTDEDRASPGDGSIDAPSTGTTASLRADAETATEGRGSSETTDATNTTDTTDTTDTTETTDSANGDGDTTRASDLPAELTEELFAFAAGVDPEFRIIVRVARSPTEQGSLAGHRVDEPPQLPAGRYWIRFTIENLDSLGTITDMNVSGLEPTPGPLGTDVCTLERPIPPSGTGTCVVGGESGFVVEPRAEFTFSATALGHRQGASSGRYFKPPIPTDLPYDDAPFSFVMVFDTTSGTRVDGRSFTTEVNMVTENVRLAKAIRVDCRDSFPRGFSELGLSPEAGEPRLLAHVIATFDAEGSGIGSCSSIPTIDFEYTRDTNSDFQVRYQVA